MDFQSVLVFAHVLALTLAISAFLILLRQLGMRTLSEGRATAARATLSLISYAMLLGVFLVCFTSGAIVCYGLLITSHLPHPALLAVRGAGLACAALASIFLHTMTQPMVRRTAGRRIVDAAPAAEILACTLAASIAILSWAIIVAAAVEPRGLVAHGASEVFPALATLLLVLWGFLSLILLGERGWREIVDFARRVKKALTPPTPIEQQRAARARRMHSMNLPVAPRRRAAA